MTISEIGDAKVVYLKMNIEELKDEMIKIIRMGGLAWITFGDSYNQILLGYHSGFYEVKTIRIGYSGWKYIASNYNFKTKRIKDDRFMFYLLKIRYFDKEMK